jgi:hypothetical protein
LKPLREVGRHAKIATPNYLKNKPVDPKGAREILLSKGLSRIRLQSMDPDTWRAAYAPIGLFTLISDDYDLHWLVTSRYINDERHRIEEHSRLVDRFEPTTERWTLSWLGMASTVVRTTQTGRLANIRIYLRRRLLRRVYDEHPWLQSRLLPKRVPGSVRLTQDDPEHLQIWIAL